MALPDPVARRPLHTRRITFAGFVRDDGLFDIEGELIDSKSEPIHMHERGDLPPGGAIHHMRVRVTVDDTLTIRAVQTAMDAAPFGYCQNAVDPVQRLVGATLGAGWRKAIEGASCCSTWPPPPSRPCRSTCPGSARRAAKSATPTRRRPTSSASANPGTARARWCSAGCPCTTGRRAGSGCFRPPLALPSYRALRGARLRSRLSYRSPP